MLKKIRKASFFPFVPLLPMAIIGGLITLEALTFARVRKLARSVSALLEAQQAQAV
jgi:hypothetical protein